MTGLTKSERDAGWTWPLWFFCMFFGTMLGVLVGQAVYGFIHGPTWTGSAACAASGLIVGLFVSRLSDRHKA